MKDTDVLIVGAGPTGLTLAASLLVKGIDVTLVDRQTEGANTSRAAAVNARTLEVLEGLDVARRMVKQGIPAPRFTIRDGRRVLIPIDFGALPTDYPFTLMLPQCDTERLLLDRVRRTRRRRDAAQGARHRHPGRRRRDRDVRPTATRSARNTSSAPTACTARCASRPESVSRRRVRRSRSSSPTST